MVKNNNISTVTSIIIGTLCVLGLVGFILANSSNIRDNTKAIGNLEGDMKVVRWMFEHQYPEAAEAYKIENGDSIEVINDHTENQD